MVVDADGSVTKMTTPNDDTKDTAMSHSARTPPLTAALEAFTDGPQVEGDGNAADGEDLDLSLLKKKKKAKKAEVDAEDDGDAAEEKGDDGDEPALDLGLKKKKKKKPKAADGEEDSFAAKLQALDLEKDGPEERPETEDLGDMDEGTGIWQHDDQKPFPYNQLLKRVSRGPRPWRSPCSASLYLLSHDADDQLQFFALLSQKNPDHASGGTRSYKIPPPQCMREGNKKTIFVNLPEYVQHSAVILQR